MELTVILPVYNEAANIANVIRDFEEKVIQKLPGSKLVIAEDGSTDGTKEVLDKLRREIDFTLISGQERKGYTKAFKDALALADTEWIFFSDSDGQHDVNDLHRMIEQKGDYDIVSGFKSPRRDPFHRIVLSRVYNGLIGTLFHLKMKDIDSGFKLIRKSVIDQVLPKVTKMTYCVMSEFIIHAYLSKFTIKEVPITHLPREFGETAIFHPSKLPGIVCGLIRDLLSIKSEYKKKSAL